MKNLVLILIVILVGVGAFFLLRPQSSPPETREAPIVSNPSSSSNYKLFSVSEYEKARSEKKAILLYFTANWCPICREQEPINEEALKGLEGDTEIVAFRVHILDSETTDENEALAEEFGVTYQHTYVFLGSNGEVSDRFTGPLSADDISERLVKAKGL